MSVCYEGFQLAGVGNVEQASVSEPFVSSVKQADGLVPVLAVGQLLVKKNNIYVNVNMKHFSKTLP